MRPLLALPVNLPASALPPHVSQAPARGMLLGPDAMRPSSACLRTAQGDAMVHREIPLPEGCGPAHALRVAANVAAAAPLIATMILGARLELPFLVRPYPGVAEDAPEGILVRQIDVATRQQAIVVRGHDSAPLPPTLGRRIVPYTQGAWLKEQPFTLVLGSGFMGMMQHLGALRCMQRLGIRPSEVCGLSSGAIAGAMYACISLDEMAHALMTLSLNDFLDPSLRTLIEQGAVCRGEAVERKIAATVERYGVTQIEQATLPLRIAVFNNETKRTEWRTQGPLARTVRQSAALPILFANQGLMDGGWVDHHGMTAMRPGVRTLSIRMNTGVQPDALARWVQRPDPLFNVSEDPAHRTVCLMPKDKLSIPGFLIDTDFRKAKLRDCIYQSDNAFAQWCMQPATV